MNSRTRISACLSISFPAWIACSESAKQAIYSKAVTNMSTLQEDMYVSELGRARSTQQEEIL